MAIGTTTPLQLLHTPPRVRFWRCRDERSEALAVAADIERLVFHEHVPAQEIAIVLAHGDAGADGGGLATALSERAIPYTAHGSAAALARAEVRDAIAWLRVLLDPRDASAAARALLRPPVEMRHVDVAQVVQIARRRRLAIVQALPAALESPQVPPEARERIERFLALHREAEAAMRQMSPGRFLDHLLQSIGVSRGGPLSAEADIAGRAASGAWLQEIAADFERRLPWAPARELAGALVSSEAGAEELEVPGPSGAGGSGAVQLVSLDRHGPLECEHAYLVGLGRIRSAPAPAPAPAAEPTPQSSEAGGGAGLGAAIDELLDGGVSRLVIVHPLSCGDAPCAPDDAVERLRDSLQASWEEPHQQAANPDELIEAALRTMRQELLDGVASIGGRIGELRLDTDVDVSHGVVRYLELVKLAALLERPSGQSVQDALADVNARLLAAVTPLQREILESSTLDEELLAGRAGRSHTGSGVGRNAAGELPLRRFLPRKGAGLLLSASDVQTYRSCPLRYKFARVLRIPADPTLSQRFGIAMHQVLERYHAEGGGELRKLMSLLEACWRRGGFGDSEQERELRAKGATALRRYHERLDEHASTPIWFERSFAFRLGRHHVRGRVDRVDRLPDGTHELIDYKTGRPRSQEQLRQDIQLSLYALAAEESWKLQSSREAYYYLLDDEKVPLPDDRPNREWVRDAVTQVGEAIMSERFEPTPSKAACGICDYRIACPVAER